GVPSYHWCVPFPPRRRTCSLPAPTSCRRRWSVGSTARTSRWIATHTAGSGRRESPSDGRFPIPQSRGRRPPSVGVCRPTSARTRPSLCPPELVPGSSLFPSSRSSHPPRPDYGIGYTIIRRKRICPGGRVRRVRDTKVDAEAIHQQNGLNPSVCVRKAAGAFVGQLGKLRPIVNRPDAALAPDGGGSQHRRA